MGRYCNYKTKDDSNFQKQRIGNHFYNFKVVEIAKNILLLIAVSTLRYKLRIARCDDLKGVGEETIQSLTLFSCKIFNKILTFKFRRPFAAVKIGVKVYDWCRYILPSVPA